jgi:type IV pilus assembly protein PilE
MKREGFTLIELMIVVAIIAIIAAIAIPSLLTAKISGHEAAIIASLRTVSSTQEQYRARYGTYGTLTALSASSFIDEVLGSGNKSGYTIAITAGVNTWTATAIPNVFNQTGVRGFMVDHSGVLRFDITGVAPTTTSPPID